MPPDYFATLLEGDKTLPEPDVVFGIEDGDGGEAPSTAPPVAQLLLNRDVKAVVDAAEEIEPAATDS